MPDWCPGAIANSLSADATLTIKAAHGIFPALLAILNGGLFKAYREGGEVSSKGQN